MRFRPNPATLIALVALFVALGGPAWAQKNVSRIIDGSKIRKSTITTRQVKAASLNRTDLNANTIRFLQKTPDRSIGSSQLSSGAITGDKLAPASIGSTQIADGTVQGIDLATNAITATNLAAKSVGFAQMADSSVGKAALRANSIGRSEIQTGGVQSDELGVALATPTFAEAIAKGECKAASFVPGIPPNETLATRFIMTALPADWPDGVTLQARALDAATLQFVACNFTAAPVNLGQRTIPYAALFPGA